MKSDSLAAWMDRWVLYVGYIYDQLPEDKKNKLVQMSSMLDGKKPAEDIKDIAGKIKHIAEQWLDAELRDKPPHVCFSVRNVLRYIARSRGISA